MTERISFGAFHLFPRERRLCRGAETIRLGSRALDILIVLAQHPGDIISQRELFAQVWPNMFIEESNLRVHVASIRKALGDGQSTARFIATIAGRGYCFVAKVEADEEICEAERPGLAEGPEYSGMGISFSGSKMRHRRAAIQEICSLVTRRRLVSIIGFGGLGKTECARAVATGLAGHFERPTIFVDLSTVTDPDLVCSAIASALPVQLSDPNTAQLIDALRDQHLLLVLDNCEHVVDAVALLAEQLMLEVPSLHLLATSREALRAGDEHIYRLRPLSVPSDPDRVDADEAMTFDAIQLFMECATAGGHAGLLSDREARIVAGICKTLDGVPMAIECVANRVGVHGIDATAGLLEESSLQLWVGRRSAPDRHSSLDASLRWTLDLLSDADLELLYRLAVFRDTFTLPSALEIAADPRRDHFRVAGALERLVDKSVLLTAADDTGLRYRLPHLVRAHLIEGSATQTAAALMLSSGATDGASDPMAGFPILADCSGGSGRYDKTRIVQLGA